MKEKLFLLINLLFSIFYVKAQEIVYMPYFEVLNMHSDYQYSTSKLFKTYVEGINKYRIVLPPKPDSTFKPETFEQTKENARKTNAKYFITGELNRIGELVVVSVSMYNSYDGTKVWGTMLKARTPDDIDPIMQKIAGNLGSTQKKPENDNIYNVTDYEARELNKINATTSVGLIIGGGYGFVSNIKNNFPAGFGLIASYDARDVMFDVKAEGYFSDMDIYSVGMDALYPFSTCKNTLFIGGGLGYSGIDIEKSTLVDYNGTSYSENSSKHGAGLILLASAGYILNRTGSVNLRFTVSPYLPLFKVGSDYPAGVLFNVAILF
jgi:hypothetical protein